MGADDTEAASFPNASVVTNCATVPKPIAGVGMRCKKSRRFIAFLLEEDVVPPGPTSTLLNPEKPD
jgi:hypothetical protein